jgi:hypothetical protein
MAWSEKSISDKGTLSQKVHCLKKYTASKSTLPQKVYCLKQYTVPNRADFREKMGSESPGRNNFPVIRGTDVSFL